MSKGGSKKPKTQAVTQPAVIETPAAAPPPEPTAEVVETEAGNLVSKEKEAKRKGTSALRIDLNVGENATTNSGLNIP